MLGLGALLFSVAFVTAFAGTPAGYSEYIVPFDEDVFAYVTDPVTAGTIGANDTTFSLISVTAWSDTVTIYYDHWENGYNYDPNNPDATADEKYIINKSQTLNFQSLNIPRPRTLADGNTYRGNVASGTSPTADCTAQPTPAAPAIHNTLNYCYDGRDRVISVGGATTLTRGGYLNTAGLGKLAAIGEEVYPLAPQLIKYVLPFGDDPARPDFERVAALIQATEDDTTVQIDFNADGVFDSFNTENGYRTARVDPVDSTVVVLQRGQTYVLDTDSNGVAGAGLPRGAIILGNKTLQVEYFYGELNSNYNTRAVSAFPRGFWSNEYYASADGGTGGTDILLYNPSASDLTINWQTSTATGSFVLSANATEFFSDATNANILVPDGSGVYLKGTAAFWGTSDIDQNGANYDWGYSLVPSYLLSDDQVVAWAPGNSPALACNAATGRGNGLFVTPAYDNTTFFIDANGDGTPDTNPSIEVLRGATVVTATGSGYKANRLDSLYITGSNSGILATSPCDLTGARIYATGPFSMSYGENPDKTTAAGGLDLGYTVLPSPSNWMDLALTVDKTTSPVLVSTVAGATTVTFTLVVDSHLFNIDSLNVLDTLPANWTYVADSTVITLPNLNQISGAAANPTVALPNLTWGPALLGSMLPNQRVTITFNARTTAAFANGDVTQNNVQAIGTRTVGGVTQTFNSRDFAFNTFTDGSLGMQLTKTSSIPPVTPVSPGDTIGYTVTVTNPASTSTTLTGISLNDVLPPGTTYVAASGSITCELPRNVRDEFSAVAYTGSNGTNAWLTNWVETDAYGGGATGAAGGFVTATGTALQLRYLNSNVRDNFNTNGSYAGNNGTANWNAAWTETNDNASAANGSISVNTNRVDFTQGTANRSISRTANVTGATSATISFTLADGGFDAGETVVIEYSIDGGAFVNVGTFDGATGFTGTNPLTVALAGNTTLQLRFRAPGTWNAAGDHAYIDNVDVSFNVPANASGSQIVRTVNLTGAITPVLNFASVPAGLGAGDTVVIEAATSAAGPFTVLATSTGNISGGAFLPAGPYNLTPYISATTAIRFRITGGYNATTKAMSIDNVDIGWGASSTFASADPPEFLASATGCRIRPNNSMTLTFSVTADTPLPTGLDEILNVVAASANEIPIPLTASARNIVLAPSGSTGSVGDRVWLDADADGIFDPGETGIGGVEVTLKDQFGTPLQITTTDSQGRYTFTDVAPGTGYYVEITGGLPTGLTQTTDTVGDAFNVNGVFTGNDGTLNWLTNWTETGDNANAATGDIRIAGNRIEFRDTVGTVVANESIQRSATVTGATTIDVQYAWAGTGLVAGSDRVIVEYSTDGVAWTTLRTINADAATTFTDSVAWTPTNNTFFLRYRTQDVLETGKLATIDNVQVRFPQNLRTANFNLAAGQTYLQADLGYRAATGTAAIGDLVWVDANNDQIRNPGEAGLAGITVQLFQDTNGDGVPDGAPIATTVTGPGGAYLFTGITANGTNDYVVTMNTGQAPLTNYTATTNTLFYFPNLPSGAVRVDADFGFRNPPAGPVTTFTISDGVWLDNGLPTGTANNGVKDGTEVGIAGVTVDLLDSAGFVVATTTTAANGSFQFTGVPGGQNYRWRVTDDAGVLADFYGTSASALTGIFQMTGNLSADQNFTATPHFGYNQTRSIGDTVWNDNGAGGGVVGNGTQDGTEPGIGGVTVQLYRDVNNNGVYEPGGADGSPYATVVTDAAGHYLFSGLPSGSRWFVSVDNTQPALSGFNTLTTAADFDGIAGNGQQRQVTPVLSGSANRLDIDYGYRTTTPFTISGRFFSDANRNGSDDTETGLQNVTVELVNSVGVVVGTATTAANGSYSFTGLPAGTYTVRVSDTNGILAGAEPTFERTELGLAASYNGQETVVLGPTTTNVNFGYYRGNALVTRAVISTFVAREVEGGVAVEWTTASEIGTVGFYLKRWDDARNRYVDVNKRLLPSLLTSPQGGLYRHLDRDAKPGQDYRYLIVEVESSGTRLAYGPYDVNTRSTASDENIDADKEIVPARADVSLRETGHSSSPRREPARKRSDRLTAARPDREGLSRRRQTGAAKIGVSESGIYYLSMDSLWTRGGLTPPPNWWSSFALTNRDEPVAFALAPDRSGLLFYGRGTSSNVERENVYRVSSARGGTWMQTRPNVMAPEPAGNESFIRSLHVEKDQIAANNIYKDPNGDFWVWDYVYAGFETKSFSFRTEGAVRSGLGTLTIRLKGGTETPANPDHHAAFFLNGSPVGDILWDGTDEVDATATFDESLLVDGENTLTIEGLTDTAAPYSLFYVDSFDVRYGSLYRAQNNRAEVPAAGHPSILITGFTEPDIAVFDISAPNQPVVVQAPVSPQADGTFGVTVASRKPNSLYYAVALSGVERVSRIQPDEPSALRRPNNEAEYLIITTEALKETAQTLAAYRSDLQAQVVDIEDIYDEFNFGIASPYAVKAFLSYARANWRIKPRYVVLVGDGTYDYKDTQGSGDNLIPPMMANTPAGLFPSDQWFVEQPNAAQSEIAIGRLPVTTSSELAEVIRKIVARENALALGESWVRSTLLVADNADEAGNFLESSEGLSGLVPGGDALTRAYLSVDGAAGARRSLIDGINQGTGVVSYFGHAGFDQLADESLLTSTDAAAFTNAERPAVLTAMTCLAGNSGLPGYSAIGETLLRQEGGGVVALWAPSGMSENDLATPLADAFYAAFYSEESSRIGDAVNASRRAYKTSHLPVYMLSIYNLLGDPAMRVR
ncbi:MAG: carboxypeptidase regulatory-like domain-containing protein [Vicinamibacteria bacterium]|nr:carboxypeptidase regulatory-like domain-containing protein [Vicinamibacteria bacterium]